MPKLIELPDDCFTIIEGMLPNHNLLLLAAAGNHRLRNKAFTTLFKRKDARGISQELLKQWSSNAFGLPKKKVILSALERLNLESQTLGLNIMSSDFSRKKPSPPQKIWAEFLKEPLSEKNHVLASLFNKKAHEQISAILQVMNQGKWYITDVVDSLSFLVPYIEDNQQRNALNELLHLFLSQSFRELPNELCIKALQVIISPNKDLKQQALNELLPALKGTDSSDCKFIFKILRTLAPHLDEDLKKQTSGALWQGLNSANIAVRRHTIYSLHALPPKLDRNLKKQALDWVLQTLNNNDDSEIQASCVQALGVLIPHLEENLKEQAIDKLLQCFKSEDSTVSNGARLEIQSIYAYFDKNHKNKALAILLPRLKSSDSDIRLSTIRALADLIIHLENNEKQQALDEILNHLVGDLDWKARYLVAKILIDLRAHLVESQKQQAIKGFLQNVKDGDWQVRKSAIKALKASINYFDESLKKQALDAFLQSLKDADWRVRKSAIKAFEASITYFDAPSKKQALDTFLQSLKDDNHRVWYAALWTLGTLANHLDKTQKIQAINRILQFTGKVELLCNLTFLDNELNKEILDRIFQHFDVVYRDEAINAFKILTPKLDKDLKNYALDRLLALSNDANVDIRVTAVQVLSTFALTLENTPKQQAIDGILKGLKDTDWWVRSSVTNELKTLATSADANLKQQAFDGLLQALNDEEWQVRRYAIWAIKNNIEDNQKSHAIAAFLKCLKNNDYRVCESAIYALCTVESSLKESEKLLALDCFLEILRWVDEPITYVIKTLNLLTSNLDEHQKKQASDKLLKKIANFEKRSNSTFVIAFAKLATKDNLKNFITILKDEQKSEDERHFFLKICNSFLVSHYSNAVNEEDTDKQYKLKEELKETLLLIEANSNTKEHFVLHRIKQQIQASECTIQLDDFRHFLISKRFNQVAALLMSPLLAPFPIEGGFIPAIEVQAFFVEACKALSKEDLRRLNEAILSLEEKTKKGLLGKGTIAQALLSLEQTLDSNCDWREKLYPMPILKKLKAQVKNTDDEVEKEYHLSLQRLIRLLYSEQKYSDCLEKMEDFILQIDSYKEQKKVTSVELTSILDDTYHFLTFNLPIEDYKEKAALWQGKPSLAMQILGGMMMAIAALMVTAGILAGLSGFLWPAAVVVTVGVAILSGGITFFAKGREQTGLAKSASLIVENRDQISGAPT